MTGHGTIKMRGKGFIDIKVLYIVQRCFASPIEIRRPVSPTKSLQDFTVDVRRSACEVMPNHKKRFGC